MLAQLVHSCVLADDANGSKPASCLALLCSTAFCCRLAEKQAGEEAGGKEKADPLSPSVSRYNFIRVHRPGRFRLGHGRSRSADVLLASLGADRSGSSAAPKNWARNRPARAENPKNKRRPAARQSLRIQLKNSGAFATG